MKFTKQFEQKVLEMHDKGLSATEIGKRTKKFTSSIIRILDRNGKKLNFEFGGSGDKHSQWKGGVVIKNGYPMKYSPNHSRRYNIPYVPMHVLVIEKAIGRTPNKTEPIHHIDLDRKNYDIKNLFLCEDSKKHQAVHRSLDRIVSKLIKSGKIKFKDGEYYYH